MSKKLTLEEVNERLRETNSEYVCLHYDGARSSKSVFRHIESEREGKSNLGSILDGCHPSWSPSCKCRKDIDVSIANERLKEANSEYECTKYAGRRLPDSEFMHIPSGKEGKSSFGSILDGCHPSWSPECKSRRDFNTSIVNERLKEANSEYRCKKYVSALSPNSLFVHVSGKSGKGSYSSIVKGRHPKWSPTYEKQKKERFLNLKLTLEGANEKLKEANSEYECLHYDGARSNKSVFKHIPSGKEGKSSFGFIMTGKHPSWSPECKSRKDIDVSIVNERLKEANSEYKCLKYDGTISNNSIFKHILSGCIGKAKYDNIISGCHPSWSPAISCKQPNDTELSVVYIIVCILNGVLYIKIGITTKTVLKRYRNKNEADPVGPSLCEINFSTGGKTAEKKALDICQENGLKLLKGKEYFEYSEDGLDIAMNYAQEEFGCSLKTLERNKAKILEAVEQLKVNNDNEIFHMDFLHEYQYGGQNQIYNHTEH